MKGLYSILLLVGSNLFMTFAWYGHFTHILSLKTVKA
ncbi:MAG: DMT family protein [Flavobacteriales bacterium]